MESSHLVATNSIRGGPNRKVLEKICETASIFEAWSDEPWVLDGVAVRVSLVCFGLDNQQSASSRLNGMDVHHIYSGLTSGGTDVARAQQLRENHNVSFMGVTKSGPFDVTGTLARGWLLSPVNVNGCSNSVILRRSVNGSEITDRITYRWLMYFENANSETEIAYYEAPYSYALEHVKPFQ